MKLKLIIAAAAISISGLAASATAQASSIQAGIHGSNGAIEVHFRDDHRGPRHRWDRRWDHRWDRRWDDRWDRHHGHRRILAPWEVRRKLTHRGFSHIRFVDTHAPVYKARATNRHGRRVFLVLNARNGAIIRVNRIRHR
ncbi:MAG TPA: hypothetical protein VK862_08650 [Afifellaceae bacterium]|nr:hypothetical protein [Afifellaceae bacterium]